MSTTFQAATKALLDNPDLLARVTAAGSAEDRQAILRAAGVAVPTHAEVNSRLVKMADVAGGTNVSSVLSSAALDLAKNWDEYTAPVVAASAGAAAA